MEQNMQRLEIGQIVNTFGIKGFVKVYPFTDDITRFEKLKTVYIKNKQYVLQEVKYQKNMVLLKLEGIDKIEDAENLRNSYLEIDRKDGKQLDKNEYYIVDLLGMEVYTDEGTLLGRLDDIYNTGSNDIYVVKDELGKQVLLPAISDVIKDINIEEKKITVHLLKGLL
jgi:16S rRNA processing protein RimM